MLPKYEPRQLTMARLTDDIMNSVLERAGFLAVSTQTAREVCYMYMSHTAVWDEELEKFQEEAAADLEEGIPALNAVAALSYDVEEAMMWEDIREYRQKLNIAEIASAMKEHNVKADPQTMSFLLAALVVGGQIALTEYDDIMEEEDISAQDVQKVKDEMGEVSK